jgi:hypothetical protein
VLFGTMWRSTIAALMLTLLAWGFVFLANSADTTLLMVRTGSEVRAEQQAGRADALREQIRSMEAGGSPSKAPAEPPPTEGGLLAGFTWAVRNAAPAGGPDAALTRARAQLLELEQRRDARRNTIGMLRWWHTLVFGVKTALPKTVETVSLMERYILDLSQMEQLRASDEPPSGVNGDFGDSDDEPPVREEVVGIRVEQELRRRSEFWVLGTSLAFEAAVLGLAAWVFCRRDF